MNGKGDFAISSPLIVTIDDYLKSEDVSVDAKKPVLNGLRSIKVDSGRPVWGEKIKQWGILLNVGSATVENGGS